MKKLVRTLLLVAVVLSLAGCGGGYGLGAGCSSDDQCEDGLACLDQRTPLSCMPNGNTCNVRCDSTEHCVEMFGEGTVCIGGCGASGCFRE